MSQINTYFKITDNSGVKKILVIENLTRKTKNIKIGDLVVGIVKEINPLSKTFYSNIVYGVVVRLKKNNNSYKKYNVLFNDNAVVLVDKNLNPIGSRIFGSIPKYLKQKNCLKLHSLTIDFF